MSDVFDVINRWAEEEVLSAIDLPRAKDRKSWVCPICGHGKGGDGIKPRISKGRVRWKCFACGKNFSNFELLAAANGIDAEKNSAEAAKFLEEKFLLKADKAFPFSREKNSVQSSVEEESEPKNFAKVYDFCRRHYDLKKFVDGQAWRGLTYETLRKAGCLYHAEYLVGENEKVPVVIIPYDETLYFWREVDGKRRGVPKGAKRDKLFEAKPISTEFPNFICEAEIDALSIAQALGEISCGVLASGGTNGFDKVLPELEKRFANAFRKPSFLIAADNDEDGVKGAKKLVSELKAAGYPADFFLFEERLKGEYQRVSADGNTETFTVTKVDANDVLRQGQLTARLIDVIGQKGEDFIMMRPEILTASQEIDSGIGDFQLGEYFAKYFFQDLALNAQYSERKTGFANLDGTGSFEREGQKQIFLPALYLLGAKPGAGKTTFAFQLSCQLAEAGESVIFCTYEQSRTELFAKVVSRELFKLRRAGQPVNLLSSTDVRLSGGNNGDVNKVAKKLATSKTGLTVSVVPPNCDISALLKSLENFIERAQREKKPAVVVVDYLQKIPPKEGKTSTKERIDETMLMLKNFQRSSNSTLIVISALNRASNQQSELSLSSFRESSEIEYSADVCWTLKLNGDSDKIKTEPRPMLFQCLKNRNGAIYDCYFNYYARNDFFEPVKENERRPVYEH